MLDYYDVLHLILLSMKWVGSIGFIIDLILGSFFLGLIAWAAIAIAGMIGNSVLSWFEQPIFE